MKIGTMLSKRRLRKIESAINDYDEKVKIQVIVKQIKINNTEINIAESSFYQIKSVL